MFLIDGVPFLVEPIIFRLQPCEFLRAGSCFFRVQIVEGGVGFCIVEVTSFFVKLVVLLLQLRLAQLHSLLGRACAWACGFGFHDGALAAADVQTALPAGFDDSRAATLLLFGLQGGTSNRLKSLNSHRTEF